MTSHPVAACSARHLDRGSPRTVLLLGDPGLRLVCPEVQDLDSPEFSREAADLVATLARFRQVHGFGRAIAAPQAGIPRRMVALDLGDGPHLLLDPRITERSPETFTLWDDCMSFPWLMVKVRRHQRIVVHYRDLSGNSQRWSIEDRATSELLQHELDHLDGVLAVDRALDPGSLVAREVFLRDRERLLAEVDPPEE